MTAELNAPVPEWMSIGVPIKVEPMPASQAEQLVYWSRSGGATNSRNRIQIPSRSIQILLDYDIDWTGNNEAGTGVSLSPDGRKLIVNSGLSSRAYEIRGDGSHSEVPLQLPHVTYDDGPKGFLREWSWVDDHTLAAWAEITDEGGHVILEGRIYVFHLKETILSRLDLTALQLNKGDVVQVKGIHTESNGLKLSAGNGVIHARADLKSPLKAAGNDSPSSTARLDAPAPTAPGSPPLEKKSGSSGEEGIIDGESSTRSGASSTIPTP